MPRFVRVSSFEAMVLFGEDDVVVVGIGDALLLESDSDSTSGLLLESDSDSTSFLLLEG